MKISDRHEDALGKWNYGTALVMLDPIFKENGLLRMRNNEMHPCWIIMRSMQLIEPQWLVMLNNYATTLPILSLPAFFLQHKKDSEIHVGRNGNPPSVSNQSTSR